LSVATWPTVSNCGSRLEWFLRELVGALGEEGLVIWVTSSEGVEADEVGVQVDLTSDESVCPKRIEREAVTEQVERAGLIGAAQEDDLAAGMERQIRLPRFREGRSWRGGFDSKC